MLQYLVRFQATARQSTINFHDHLLLKFTWQLPVVFQS
jgi:hypothetical protein